MNKLKFSIIVPVYNVEKYLEKCIDSILNQTYKNYEIIIINDGSTDKSTEILNNYKNNKQIKIINQKNYGLSAARNEGLNHINGDYVLFVDSDDYIEENLLENLNKKISNEDLIRFQVKTLNEDYKIIEEYNELEFTNLSGTDAFKKIVNYNFIELACLYAYKKELIKNYKFKENTYHEDFGLIPLLIIKSKRVSSINYIGYNYLQRTNSIMNNDNYEKTLKKAFDTLEHYKYLKKETKDIKDIKIFNSFIANSTILKLNTLKKEDYKKYLKELKQENVFNDLLNDSLTRKIKKIILKINPKLYFKMR